MSHRLNPVDCDDSRPERRNPPREWEPEPLHLPLEMPRHRPVGPSSTDDAPSEPESRVIVIDLA